MLEAMLAARRRPPRRAAAARPRARDHARLAPARAGGRLRRLRRPLRGHARRRRRAHRLPARARRHLPAPDAAPARAPRAQRRRLRGRRTSAPSTRRWGRSRTSRRWPGGCGSTASACAWTSSSTTRRASTSGRARARAGDEEMLARYLTFPDRELPDAYERTLPEVFPDVAPGNFTEVEFAGGPRWVWTTFNDFQWDLDYTNPAVFRAMAEAMLALANRGVEVLRLDAAPFLWKRLGTNCQNQPEVHDILQALRAIVPRRRPGGRVQGGGDRLAARPRALPGHRAARGQGVRPRLPQLADGAAVERARHRQGGADDAHAARDAARPARAGVHHLRALPRRHRLGDHRGGRGRGRARTATCTGASWPTSTRASFPAVRPRRPLPGRPAHRRGAHQRDRGGARRAAVGGGAARRGAGDPAHPAALRRRLLLRRAAADLDGRRARPARRPGVPRRPGARARQPLAAPAADGLGGGGAARGSRVGRGPPVGRHPATGGGAQPRRARCTPRARPRRCGRATSTSSATSARHAGEALLCLANFTPVPQPVALETAHGFTLDAPVPDDRPLRAEGDFLVLEPYQLTWLRSG